MPTFAAVQMEPKLFDSEANLMKVSDRLHARGVDPQC